MAPSLKKIFFITVFTMLASFSGAQDTIYIDSRLRDTIYLAEPETAYFIDTSDKMDIKEVMTRQFTASKSPAEEINKKFGYKKIRVWLRWNLANPKAKTDTILFIFHRNNFLQLYAVGDGGTQHINGRPSFYSSKTKKQRKTYPVEVPGNGTVTVYTSQPNQTPVLLVGSPVLATPESWDRFFSQSWYERRYYVFVDLVFLSIIFFITLHTLAQYYFNRRKEFLLYAFYTAAVLVYFTFKFDDYAHVDITFSHFPYLHKYGNNMLSYLMYFGYYRFVRNFIDFKAIAPWFFKLIIFTERLLLTVIVVDFAITFFNLMPIRYLIFNVVRCYLLLTGFTGIYLLVRSRNKLAYFIAAGSGFLLLGGLFSMVLTWFQPQPYSGFDPITYMQLGMVIELLCFTLGLSYKMSLIEKEKISTQQQLIGQLEENKQLQEQMTTQLESRVQEQMSKILAQQQLLEKEKEAHLTLEFKKKLTEMELQLLKSQLNPHFYFNTLNNLYGLTIIDPKKAPDAILKLSDIMEYVIYDCKSEKVPLGNELKFIRSYIELEKLRYEDNGRIQLHLSGNPEGKFISPLLLIQFVENAFKHGIEHSRNDNYLDVEIIIDGDHLTYRSINRIRELNYNGNGVGLANVRKRLEMLYPGHQLHIDNKGQDFKVELELTLN